MKKLIVLSLIFLVFTSLYTLPVKAQDRDGGDPVLSLGICAIIQQSSERDGVSVWAGHWIDLNDNLEPFTEIHITLSGYENPAYWDFGLPQIPGEENTYSLTPGFLYGWTRSLYQLGSDSQDLSVTINGIAKTIYIPTYIEAYQMLVNGEILECPDPWPEPAKLHNIFFPLIINGQN